MDSNPDKKTPVKEISKSKNQKPDEKRKRFNSENHSMKKRLPPRPFQRENDIYITSKSNFKAQQKQCEEILNSEVGEVFLHCLGNAITRGINLGLTIQKNSNDLYGLEANTNTVELVDDFHPLKDDDDFAVQRRMNSSLHIRIFRHTKLATI